MIPYGQHDITASDIEAVVNVLQSSALTQGPLVPIFESTLAKFVGAEYAVAVNSATSALHLACRALGLGVGDWLWTTPITFVASANCALYCGARVDFVDIDINTFNICLVALEEKLEQAQKNGILPKALVAVHFAGQPCEMEKIYFLSQKYGFRIIEDASHAIGSKYRGQYVGGCVYSDITIFSFHPVKIITAGEGGMALTNCANLADKMRLLRSHGITRDEFMMTNTSDGPWYYEQIDLGYNYRMTDVLAALGLSQLERLNENIYQRHKLAIRYNQAFSEFPISIQQPKPDCYTALHLYAIRLELDGIKKTRLEIFQAMRERNVGVNVHYIPVYRQPYYQSMGFKKEDFPMAEKYYSEALSLPLFPTLTSLQQEQVILALQETLNS